MDQLTDWHSFQGFQEIHSDSSPLLNNVVCRRSEQSSHWLHLWHSLCAIRSVHVTWNKDPLCYKTEQYTQYVCVCLCHVISSLLYRAFSSLCLNKQDAVWQDLMGVLSVALLPWESRSRRWLGHSPHGSSGRGGQTCTRHQTASRCLSETHDTLPGSAIWCPVPWSCWRPLESNTLSGGGDGWTENCLMGAKGWLIVMQRKKKKSPAKNTEKNRSKNIFPQRRKRAASPFWLVYFRGMFISSSWEKWQLKFHWGEIEGGLTVSRVQLCLKGEKKEQLLLGTSLWHAWICHRASVPSPESTDAHRKLLLHSRQHGRAWGGRCEWNKKQNLIGMVSLPWWSEVAAQLRVCEDCSSATWDGWLCGCQDKIQPPFKAKRTASPVLLSSSSRRHLTVGTLEFHFLLLFQSLSHPPLTVVCSPVVILLTDLSSACPCLLWKQKGKH